MRLSGGRRYTRGYVAVCQLQPITSPASLMEVTGGRGKYGQIRFLPAPAEAGADSLISLTLGEMLYRM